MTGVARLGDVVTGTCKAHPTPLTFTATFIQGDSVLLADGRPVVCVGHLGKTSCGHTVMAMSGSSVMSGASGPVHRIGDPCIVLEGGSGTTVSGSSSLIVES